ncbi:MAG: hypothetical protein JXC32_02135, partial [Anaerolineae bacterium]|nr:hypothetical protein [Anaerolineae bacterium]
RVYVDVLIKNWMWIVGAVIISAVVAFGVSRLLPPTYEASALVAITDARYIMQFDPRLETNEIEPSYAIFKDLAVSDDVLQALWEELPTQPAELEQWQSLRGMVEAENASDPSLLRLKATSSYAQETAEIANTWARVLVRYVNDIYGATGDDLGFFSEQLERAERDLADAEAALVAFQSTNQIDVLGNELSAKLNAQKHYLSDRDNISYLMQDIRDLRAQLANQPASYSITFGDRLTALSLQVKAFNAQSGIPIQLQITDPDALSDQSLGEQLDLLDGLVLTLERRSEQVSQQLAALEPEILALQERLQLAQTERDRLKRAQSVADETYVTLSRKVEESKITAGDQDGQMLLASRAAVPERPVGPRTLLNTAIAGAAAGMLSVLVVFVLEWWQQDEEPSPTTPVSAESLRA